MLRVNFRLPRNLSEGEGDEFYWIRLAYLKNASRKKKKLPSLLLKKGFLRKLLTQV